MRYGPSIPDNPDVWAGRALRAMFARVWRRLKPPPRIDGAQWSTKYRVLSNEESALKGRFSWAVSPALREIAAMATQPSVRKIVVQKSAQVGYTAGIVCNIIGYHIHYRPSVIVAAFPRTQAAKDFAAEKLDPMILSTKVLSRRIIIKSRAHGNSTLRKRFAGGLIKLVGTNSPSDVKSTSARLVIVEEPDDAASDVRGQGSSVKLLEERAKTYPDHLILIGGTPTAKDASVVEDEMRKTDKRYFHVPCHGCGDSHVPAWENVTIPEDLDAPLHEVYGRHQHARAFYACPHCGELWSEEQRIANIRRAERDGGGWVATQASETPGYYLNELLSTFDGSRVPVLARKYLEAKANLDKGDAGDMIAFTNSTLGLTWEYRGELPEEETLRARAMKYAEWSCPVGGLVPLMTVDVQHDRLAVTVWVVGRGEEMWLAYWGELFGKTVVPYDGAWLELEQLMARRVRHSTGAGLPLTAVAIDSSDGQTSDAVYAFVRKHDRSNRHVFAIKGAPDAVGRVEIWSPPKKIDPNVRSTKAARAGISISIIGTAKAKDLILGWSEQAGRVRLEGEGPARMHWYEGVRDDFYEQLLSEIKIPGRVNKNVREWKPRTDRRNEALDCTVYAVWLSRALRLHLRKPAQWDMAESQVRQAPLLEEGDDGVYSPPSTTAGTPAGQTAAATTEQPSPFQPPAPQVPVRPTPPARPHAVPRAPSSFASDDWSDRL
ncbi:MULTISPECIES: terminase gpA endonuclease subunit [unclassified Variovorax]|uniref:phage terminase large subunit family protein n=1 Tax=unclassified Variovorax TaxID=663243 RepID=UPI002577D087|nr:MULTISPECIES: terminase gpA endonuclease subunit [unclassified Variovorax]MDM0086760.1 phage terminase large subunit family protein [Variovorax sp. J22G40]MDM0144984.1 phage terminase large subunit family protein [Variovorax sp. J2P1-31]